MNQQFAQRLTQFRRTDTFALTRDTPGLEIRVQEGKYGIVNCLGDEVVPFRYQNLYSVSPGFCITVRNGKLGLLRILWDPSQKKFSLHRALRCEYDMITPTPARIFLLCKNHRFAWMSQRRCTVSAEFDRVTLHGIRFVSCEGGLLEKTVLVDLSGGMAHTFDFAASFRFLGRNGTQDVMLQIYEKNSRCRLCFFSDDGTARFGSEYDEIRPFGQQVCGMPLQLRWFSAYDREQNRQFLLDAQGREIWSGNEDESLRVEARTADGKLITAASTGFSDWDGTPVFMPPSSSLDGKENQSDASENGLDTVSSVDELAEIAKRALFDGSVVPPLTFQLPTLKISQGRRWGTVRSPLPALVRAVKSQKKNR